MKSSEIRKKFLQFFESEGHILVPSSSLLPTNDPSLLFTNSGMVQFKDVFLGKDQRPYTRAVSVQKSIRAGGKHNDLENVGYTTKHHTFFEMLGNFSFGDYFKDQAIFFAWKLLTEIYKLSPERLWVSVYDKDDESYFIWNSKIGIPPSRLIRIGDQHSKYDSANFWQMSEVGPCGPCSEIFYDRGPNFHGNIPGSPEGEGERYLEIWNLVFMQFDRDQSGQIKYIPQPCVDTGMGLERIASVLQDVHSNYDIDIFQALIFACARETNTDNLSNNSLKVIADHIRSSSFLITDGILPTNEGRGYVLRRIIRRALMHGYKLGQTKPFFHKIVIDLSKEMEDVYPNLHKNVRHISEVLKLEEDKFGKTLGRGLKILKSTIASMKFGDKLDGNIIFSLYDTYGFPIDLTSDVCQEYGIKMDINGFELAMNNQRRRARAASFSIHGSQPSIQKFNYDDKKTSFLGFDNFIIDKVKIIAMFSNEVKINLAELGKEIVVILDRTPFYPQSGGQVGDTGLLEDESASFLVSDTREIKPGVIGHYGCLRSGTLFPGKLLKATIDKNRRIAIQRNHSVTHLLHQALRHVFGKQIRQCGSLITSEKLRFDFSQNVPMNQREIVKIESIINSEILENRIVNIRTMTYEDAVKNGSIALFSEKYQSLVRVVDIGFSSELCGGTHVSRTGDIGFFKITAEESIGFGIRRVEAVTGEAALFWVQNQNSLLNGIAKMLHTKIHDIPECILQVQDRAKTVNKILKKTRANLACNIARGLDRSIKRISIGRDIDLLIAWISEYDLELLRIIAEDLKSRLEKSVTIVASFSKNTVCIVSSVTNDISEYVNAHCLIQFLTSKIGGKGGGRHDIAVGSCNRISNESLIKKSITSYSHDWIKDRIQNSNSN